MGWQWSRSRWICAAVLVAAGASAPGISAAVSAAPSPAHQPRVVIAHADIVGADVDYVARTTTWAVQLTLTVAAEHRLVETLSADRAPTVAAVVDDDVVATPAFTPYIDNAVIKIAPVAMTRAQAITLATAITGRRPAHIDSEPAANDTMHMGTQLCEQNLRSTAAQSISLVGAATGAEIAKIYAGFGRSARPWSQVAANELVVQCDFTSPPQARTSVFVDAAGHCTTTPIARPLP